MAAAAAERTAAIWVRVSGTQGDESRFDEAAAGLSPWVHHFAWYGVPSKSTLDAVLNAVVPSQFG